MPTCRSLYADKPSNVAVYFGHAPANLLPSPFACPPQVAELEVSKTVAERTLREHGGKLQEALQALVNAA